MAWWWSHNYRQPKGGSSCTQTPGHCVGSSRDRPSSSGGVTQAEIARQMQVSRDTVGKWWRRYQADQSRHDRQQDRIHLKDLRCSPRQSHPRPYPPPPTPTQRQSRTIHRTFIEERAHACIYISGHDRIQAMTDWIHDYNHHRGHTAIGGPPISRVDNLPGSYNYAWVCASCRPGLKALDLSLPAE